MIYNHYFYLILDLQLFMATNTNLNPHFISCQQLLSALYEILIKPHSNDINNLDYKLYSIRQIRSLQTEPETWKPRPGQTWIWVWTGKFSFKFTRAGSGVAHDFSVNPDFHTNSG
jgi:hypothetical protein